MRTDNYSNKIFYTDKEGFLIEEICGYFFNTEKSISVYCRNNNIPFQLNDLDSCGFLLHYFAYNGQNFPYKEKYETELIELSV